MKNAKAILDALQPTLKSGTETERDMAIRLLGTLMGSDTQGDVVPKTINMVLEANLSMETSFGFFVAILTAWPEYIIQILQRIQIRSGLINNANIFLPAFTVAVLQCSRYFKSFGGDGCGFGDAGDILNRMFSLSAFGEIKKLKDPMTGKLSNAITEFVTHIPYQHLFNKIGQGIILDRANEDTFLYQIINGLCMGVFGIKSLKTKLFLLEKGK
jgi:hypothetical protein